MFKNIQHIRFPSSSCFKTATFLSSLWHPSLFWRRTSIYFQQIRRKP